VVLLEAHFPAEREVETKERVANIHKVGVHPCRQKREGYWKGLLSFKAKH